MEEFIRNCPNCGKILKYKTKEGMNQAIKNNKNCISCNNKLRKLDKKYKRNCPQCGKEVFYTSKCAAEKATENNIICPSCNRKNQKLLITKFVRNCPSCGNKIKYKTKEGMEFAENKNSKCQSCANKELNNRSEVRQKLIESRSGNNNGMHGKSVYDVWLQKYGKEIADQKLWEMKNKQSIASSGESNPMYGKPSPKKSGNGWSGYYQNHYFRSILELHYLVYLLDNNINFESGEKRKHMIQYEMDGIKRNYFSDYYLINEDKYIEIKPKALIGSYQNKLKFEAAKNKLGNKHIILTEDQIIKIDLQRLYNMYINKEIIFDKGYSIKFEEYYLEHRKDI